MKKITTISIITLTYKNWHLLDAAILSVNNQIVSPKYNVEYLIVDDGTEDFDEAVIDNALTMCPFDFKIITNENNVGTVQSFNRAILQSKGDIIIPLSADDEFYDSYVVGNIINAFETSNESIITGLRVPVSGRKELGVLPYKKDRVLFSDSQKLLKRLSKGNIISGASTYYKRSVFDEIGFFDEGYKLLEDFPFYLKALNSGISVFLLNKKTIKYGVAGLTSSSQINPLLKKDLIKVLDYNAKINKSSVFQQRYLSYRVLMDKKEKLKLMNILLYLDCFATSIFNFIIKKISK